MNGLEVTHLLLWTPLAIALGYLTMELRTIKAQQVEALQRLTRLEAHVLNGRK